VRNEVVRDGYRWITLVTDSQPEIEIVLSQPHAGRGQEHGDALAALLAEGEPQMVQLRSDDLDATFDDVAAAPDAEVLQEPITQTSGVRDIAVRDPAGNHVRIEQAAIRDDRNSSSGRRDLSGRVPGIRSRRGRWTRRSARSR
jgi:hypothetical protein